MLLAHSRVFLKLGDPGNHLLIIRNKIFGNGLGDSYVEKRPDDASVILRWR